jgi:hypothetical protein
MQGWECCGRDVEILAGLLEPGPHALLGISIDALRGEAVLSCVLDNAVLRLIVAG